MYGIWLVSFEEFLGAAGTATKPDFVITNPAWLRAQQNAPLDVLTRKRSNSQRPYQIPLWDSVEKAWAEIRAWEPEHYVPGAERVREYKGSMTGGPLLAGAD